MGDAHRLFVSGRVTIWLSTWCLTVSQEWPRNGADFRSDSEDYFFGDAILQSPAYLSGSWTILSPSYSLQHGVS